MSQDPVTSSVLPAAERARRRKFLEGLIAGSGAGHALLYAANRSPGSVTWLTGWPVTREAAVLVTPGEPDVMWIGFPNHVPNARRLCPDADVRPAGVDLGELLADELGRRGAAGVVAAGNPPRVISGRLESRLTVTWVDDSLARFRMIKSADEIAVLRASARLTDAGMAAVLAAAARGATELEAVAEFQRVCTLAAGYPHIAYVATTSLGRPDRVVPGQWPTGRAIAPGNVLTFELSGAVEPDYPGQVLRTVVVRGEPTELLLSLHGVAEQVERALLAQIRPGALPADLLAIAGSIVDEAGLDTVDDVVHGFGGGYLPPVLSLAHPRAAPGFAEPLASGMALVVQPNVTSPAGLGVQTGELIVVTDSGCARLHQAPRGLLSA